MKNVFPSRKLFSFSDRQPIHDLVDKSKELRVLDAKAAQNFGSKNEKQKFFLGNLLFFFGLDFLAIMFSQLKVSPMTFRDWMLSCDHENFKYDFLKQLEKYLPSVDELKVLADFRNEINDLQYSEQYFSAVKSSSFSFSSSFSMFY